MHTYSLVIALLLWHSIEFINNVIIRLHFTSESAFQAQEKYQTANK